MRQENFELVALDQGVIISILEKIIPSYGRSRILYREVSEHATSLQKQLTISQKELSTSKEKIITHQEQIANLQSTNTELEESLSELHCRLAATQNNLNLAELELGAIRPKLHILEQRFQLVAQAISAEPDNTEQYKAFSNVLNNQFFPFANRVNVLTNDTEAFVRIKAVEDKLRVLEAMERFKNKTLVAVSGGFSSGKSSFISSLMSDTRISLPIAIQASTAIPTYVFHAEQSRIVGHCENGGKVDIPFDMYAKLSHEFVKETKINIRKILPFIALETPMDTYKNLSFIDLPGYNPAAGDGILTGDKSSAAEFMGQASCILWVIGFDSNGDIQKDDLEFINKVLPKDKPPALYIILNKADLRSSDALSDIMQTVADSLEISGIEYQGISAYTSNTQEELLFHKKSLREVLLEWNNFPLSSASLIDELGTVFADYENAFLDEIANRKEKASLIHSLKLDLLEAGAFDESNEDVSKRHKSFLSSLFSSGFKSTKDEINPTIKKSIKSRLAEWEGGYECVSLENDLAELRLIWKDFEQVLTLR